MPRIVVHAQPAEVFGDDALLEQLVENLVENGTRYNVPGGEVVVNVGTHDDTVTIEVSNTGPVVPPEAVPGLFEPFRRLSADRTATHVSAGLGLSIVRAVATAHGGTVEASAQPAGGLDVVVELPAAHWDRAIPASSPAGRALVPWGADVRLA
jgi:signal transduction histidine kinase